MTSSPIVLCRVKALYTFEGTEPTGLNFKKGDIIEVLAQLDSGWWDGWCDGKRGWFPSNYVEAIDDASESSDASQYDVPEQEPGGLLSDRRTTDEPQTQRISRTGVPLDTKHHRLSFTGMDNDDPVTNDQGNNNRFDQEQMFLGNSSQLPPGWRLQLTDQGHVFYNEITGEVRHNLDLDDDEGSASESGEEDRLLDPAEDLESRDGHTRSSYSESLDDASMFEGSITPVSNPMEGVKLPEHWISGVTPEGKAYFKHEITNDVVWDLPSVLQSSRNQVHSTSHSRQYIASPLSINTNAPAITPRSKSRQSVKQSEFSILDTNEPLTWTRMFSHVSLAVQHLDIVIELGAIQEYDTRVSAVVNAIRSMLFGSHTLEKESIHLKNSRNLKLQHRNIMTSISKLVLAVKAASEATSSQKDEFSIKIKEESNDLLNTVQNFVSQCQDMHISIRHVDPRIVDQTTETRSHRRTDTSSSGQLPLIPPKRARRQLSKELVTRLQTYETQLQTSLETLVNCLQKIAPYELQSEQTDDDLYSTSELALPVLLAEFKESTKHLGHWLSLLDSIDLTSIQELDRNFIRVHKQKLYDSSGILCSTIQIVSSGSSSADVHEVIKITKDIETLITSITSIFELYKEIYEEGGNKGLDTETLASNSSEVASLAIADGSATDEQMRVAAKQDDDAFSEDSSLDEFDKAYRKHSDNASRVSEAMPRDQTAELSSLASSRSPTDKLRKFFGEDAAAAAAVVATTYSPKANTTGNVWYLGYDYKPNDIVFNMEGSVRGGTLETLVERLTLHDYLDMNFIATFLLTYRSFCKTEELISLLQKRYSLAPPEELTMEELEIWVEKKLKLVRLRVFNVLKTWIENYYYEEDYGVLEDLKHFSITIIRDTLTFAAEQLERLIDRRLNSDCGSDLKKMVLNVNAPTPVPQLPRNMKRIRLLDVEPLELARQLTIIDFKLYSAIRPIECLDKAWSRDDETGSTASNVKASILFCNQVTAWVSDSILSHHEAKKRAAILKHWVLVAERCRQLGNFNTCMAVLSAFDNSAIGRLKRTWEIVGARTNQMLAQIRKMMGHEKNFIEYREIIHSINPPCIPFLGIYLQDLTFIEDGNSNYLKKSQSLINFAKRMKTAEVIREIQQYQSAPYHLQTVREIQLFIKSHLENSRDEEVLYGLSVALEPKEREDEKIARLLQESGFL